MRVSGKDKYCFNKQLAEQLFRIKKTRKKNDNSTSSADYEFLDESDESHFDLREDVCMYNVQCTCPIPKSVQLEDEDGLLFDAEVVNQLSRFCQFKE